MVNDGWLIQIVLPMHFTWFIERLVIELIVEELIQKKIDIPSQEMNFREIIFKSWLNVIYIRLPLFWDEYQAALYLYNKFPKTHPISLAPQE